MVMMMFEEQKKKLKIEDPLTLVAFDEWCEKLGDDCTTNVNTLHARVEAAVDCLNYIDKFLDL